MKKFILGISAFALLTVAAALAAALAAAGCNDDGHHSAGINETEGEIKTGVTLPAGTITIGRFKYTPFEDVGTYPQFIDFSGMPGWFIYTPYSYDYHIHIGDNKVEAKYAIQALAGTPPGSYNFKLYLYFGNGPYMTWEHINPEAKLEVDFMAFVTDNPQPETRNMSLFFDGSNDIVDFGEDPALTPDNEFTFEFWMKTETDTEAVVFEKYDYAAGRGLRITVDGSGRLDALFAGPGGTTVLSSEEALNDFEWHHVALVYFKDVFVSLLVDGHNDDTEPFGALPSTTIRMLAGEAAEGTPRTYSGFLDEIRLWTDALTEEEIRTAMSRSADPNNTMLAAYWSADSGSGYTLYDITLHGFDGTLGGYPVDVDAAPAWSAEAPWEYIE